MALFVIACIDRPNSVDLRLATRQDHLAFLNAATGIKIAGPFLNEGGQMIGSMFVIEARSLEDAHSFAARDPYAKAGLFETCTVRAWRQTAGSVPL